jgi:nucleoside-diphosphate-sugar epimerase
MSQARSSVVAWVAGATGYTGRAVVARLAAQGTDVRAHVRPDSRGLQRWTDEFAAQGATVEVVAWEPAAIEAALRRVAPTQVYALLGTTVARARAAERAGEAPADYERVDVGMTLMLLNACRTLSNPPRFVYLSSIGAHPRARGAYLQARARVEEELRRSGVPYTIARPSFITGPDRDESRPLERAAATVGDAALSLLGAFGARRLAARWRSTSNVSLAEALVRAAADPAAENSVLESEQLRDGGPEAEHR